jgi:hypothetical protein
MEFKSDYERTCAVWKAYYNIKDVLDAKRVDSPMFPQMPVVVTVNNPDEECVFGRSVVYVTPTTTPTEFTESVLKFVRYYLWKAVLTMCDFEADYDNDFSVQLRHNKIISTYPVWSASMADKTATSKPVRWVHYLSMLDADTRAFMGKE